MRLLNPGATSSECCPDNWLVYKVEARDFRDILYPAQYCILHLLLSQRTETLHLMTAIVNISTGTSICASSSILNATDVDGPRSATFAASSYAILSRSERMTERPEWLFLVSSLRQMIWPNGVVSICIRSRAPMAPTMRYGCNANAFVGVRNWGHICADTARREMHGLKLPGSLLCTTSLRGVML